MTSSQKRARYSYIIDGRY